MNIINNSDLRLILDFENKNDAQIGIMLDKDQRGVDFTAYKNMPDGHLRICTENVNFYEIATNPNCVADVLEKLKNDISR